MKWTAMNEFREFKRKLSQIILAAACVFCVSLSGCGGTPVWQRDDPDEVVAGFLSAVEAQDSDVVWEFLSSQTREKLEKRAEDFNNLPEHGNTVRGRDMLRFGHVLSSTREYKKIIVASSDETHAAVQIVLHDGAVIPVDLHRESNRWTVDLPLEKSEN